MPLKNYEGVPIPNVREVFNINEHIKFIGLFFIRLTKALIFFVRPFIFALVGEQYVGYLYSLMPLLTRLL